MHFYSASSLKQVGAQTHAHGLQNSCRARQPLHHMRFLLVCMLIWKIRMITCKSTFLGEITVPRSLHANQPLFYILIKNMCLVSFTKDWISSLPNLHIFFSGSQKSLTDPFPHFYTVFRYYWLYFVLNI